VKREEKQRGGKTYPSKFKHFGGQILQHGSDVHGSLGTDAHFVLRVLLEKTLDAAARELEWSGLATTQ
jgi:hypothetical protein